MLFSFVLLAHLIGLALGVGAGTIKLILLLKGNADYSFLPAYFKVSKAITRTLIIGVVILTISGIGWLLMGYGFTTLLFIKIFLVLCIFIVGIYIDNAVEPKVQRLFPPAGESPSPLFVRAQKKHLIFEIFADALFYAIMVIWVLR